MEIKTVERIPTAAEYNDFRKAVGWGTYDPAVAVEFLPNSLYGVCAYDGIKLIGMARVIGDGGLVFYIQDVIVLPDYQKQGIGTKIMEHVMDYIRRHSHDNTIVGLMSAKGMEKFYEKFDFICRPTEKFGAGMTLFWKK